MKFGSDVRGPRRIILMTDPLRFHLELSHVDSFGFFGGAAYGTVFIQSCSGLPAGHTDTCNLTRNPFIFSAVPKSSFT